MRSVLRPVELTSSSSGYQSAWLHHHSPLAIANAIPLTRTSGRATGIGLYHKAGKHDDQKLCCNNQNTQLLSSQSN
eukprot:6195461-Pleurochrysis_carterae.AAC.1